MTNPIELMSAKLNAFEETDGARTRQREGWTSGDNPPRQRRAASAAANAASAAA